MAEINPTLWSVARKASLDYIANAKREKLPKGWICDIPYQQVPSQEIAHYIKEKYIAGQFEIRLFDEYCREISTRSLDIPLENKRQKLYEICRIKPEETIRLPHQESIACLVFSDGESYLRFETFDNQSAHFLGHCLIDIESLEIKILWRTTAWKAGTTEWFATIINNEKSFTGFARTQTTKELFDYCTTIKIEGNIKGPFQFEISRRSMSAEDTLDGDVLVTGIEIYGLDPGEERYECSDICYKVYEKTNHDIDIIEEVVKKIEKSPMLRISGGFVDLLMVAEDLNVRQEVVVEIANEFLALNHDFFSGTLTVKKYKAEEFGDVYVVKKKRWDWLPF